jgi:hypothetical protein
MQALSRNEALEHQSREHLQFALDSGQTDAAYQAGYFALMSALSTDEVSTFADHPSAAAAALGAERLQLQRDDCVLAEEGAAGYYSPKPASGQPLSAHVAWARRARAAAGWSA